MRHRAIVASIGGAVSLLIVAGCHGQAGTPRSSVRDSLGLRISLTDLRDSISIPSCRLAAEPTLRIGTQMGDTSQELYDVRDARRMSDGRIVVLSGGSHDVKLFDATGRLLTQLGREGDGPGEFRVPMKLSLLSGDSVAVWDTGLRRVSVLDVDGGGTREVELDPTPAYPNAQFAVLGGDFVIGSQLYRPGRGAELVHQGLLLLRYDRTGVLVDTLTTLPNGEEGWITAGGRAMFGRPLFGSRALFSSGGTRVYATGGLQPAVEAFDFAGKAVAAVRWQPPGRRVTDADLKFFRENRLRGTSAAARRVLNQWLEATPVAKTFPASAGILVGSQGDLWVETYQRPGADAETWLSFARDGHFRCRATLTHGFRALAFGDTWVLGVGRNDLDVEHVEIWPLGKARDVQKAEPSSEKQRTGVHGRSVD